ncbi:MAG: hypothetical protein JWN37_841 [Candidatus Nomurabacteria bacterium]|nr:hypothetical protein [Candidatus Nomurabacteria bacterium]
MAILTAILMSGYPETSTRITLANNTHSLALLVREAQIRGSAIDSGNITLNSESPIGGYGVFIQLSTPNKLILFKDVIDSNVPKPYGLSIGNGLYENGNPIDETKSITTLSKSFTIYKLCVGNGFPFTCNSANTPVINSLTISFTRPDPEPHIYINNNSGVNYSAACIELRSPYAPRSGHIRSVQVFNSGMIRTQIGKCDNSSS